MYEIQERWWRGGAGFAQVASNIRGYLVQTMEDDRVKYEMRNESLIMVQKALSNVNNQARAHGDVDYIDRELVTALEALRTDEAL